MLENIEELICLQAPYSVCLLFRVLGYNLCIQLIKLNEVWPFEDEVCEKFLSTSISFLKLTIALIKSRVTYSKGRVLHFILEHPSGLSLTETMKIDSFRLFMKMDLIFSFSETFRIRVFWVTICFIRENFDLTFVVGSANSINCQNHDELIMYEELLDGIVPVSIHKVNRSL